MKHVQAALTGHLELLLGVFQECPLTTELLRIQSLAGFNFKKLQFQSRAKRHL